MGVRSIALQVDARACLVDCCGLDRDCDVCGVIEGIVVLLIESSKIGTNKFMWNRWFLYRVERSRG